jgi:hypothetical protein
MDRLLARLERRFGRLAIEGLPALLAGGMLVVLVLAYVNPRTLSLLTLSPPAVRRGEVWRLVTYLFLPQGSASSFWTLFNIYWVWLVAAGLEAEWGAFKLNAYYFLGMLGTTGAAFLVGSAVGNFYLNVSLVLAFATIFPSFEVRLFWILPVPMKFLGWLAFAYALYEAVNGDWVVRAAIIASLSNYLLFFAGDILRLLRGSQLQARQAARRASSAPPPALADLARACAICGAREADGADIRVCSCEKCKAATGGQARTLCLEHARAH